MATTIYDTLRPRTVPPAKRLPAAFALRSGRTLRQAERYIDKRLPQAVEDLTAYALAAVDAESQMQLLVRLAPLLAALETTEESLTPVSREDWEGTIRAFCRADAEDDLARTDWLLSPDEPTTRRLRGRLESTIAITRRFLAGLRVHHQLKGVRNVRPA